MQTIVFHIILNVLVTVQFLIGAPERAVDEELSEAEEDRLDEVAFSALQKWLAAIQVHPRAARLETGKILAGHGLSRPHDLFMYFSSTVRDSANTELRLPSGHMMSLYQAAPYLDVSLHELEAREESDEEVPAAGA